MLPATAKLVLPTPLITPLFLPLPTAATVHRPPPFVSCVSAIYSHFMHVFSSFHHCAWTYCTTIPYHRLFSRRSPSTDLCLRVLVLLNRTNRFAWHARCVHYHYHRGSYTYLPLPPPTCRRTPFHITFWTAAHFGSTPHICCSLDTFGWFTLVRFNTAISHTMPYGCATCPHVGIQLFTILGHSRLHFYHAVPPPFSRLWLR